MESLSTSLQAYHINALQEISDHLGLQPEKRPARKDWLVRELSWAIPKVAQSETVVQSLSEAERGALAVARAANTTISVRDVAMPLILAGLIYVDGVPTTASQPKLQDVLASLLRKGLIINVSEPQGTSLLRTFMPVYRFVIPEEVREVLPQTLLAIPQPRPSMMGLASPPARVREGELQQFLRQLFFMWSELRQQPALRLKSGDIGKRDRRRIAQALGLDEQEEDLAWVSTLHNVLESLHLTNEVDRNITAVDTDAAKLFWASTPVHQLRDLMVGYSRLSTSLRPEELLDNFSGFYRGFNLRSASEMRERVLQTLGEIAELEWVPFSLFLALLTGGRVGSFIFETEMLEVMLDSLRWYGANYRTDMEASLQTVEHEVLRAVLDELHTLGFVDLGYPKISDTASRHPSEPGYPCALRLTRWVRAYYNGVLPDGGEMVGQVILQPDFQLLALGPVSLQVLANLEQFAEREKIDESVITYRITRESVYQAFQRGESTATILGYLEDAIDQQGVVPQNIERSIEEWRHQHERIVVRREVSILQVDRPELLERLLDDTQVKQYVHRLDDRTAWIWPADIDRVEARLFELGDLPAHSRGPVNDLDHSLCWHDGGLQPRAPLPSLYVTGSLRRFAEPNNGRWQLTPETVQGAVSRGLDPLEMIELLETMTGESLPEIWYQRLKAWGNHFGDGSVAHVRLLRLKRAGALYELREADEQLHRWLRPLPGTTDLAIINETHWDEVVELLQAWGIEIENDRWW